MYFFLIYRILRERVMVFNATFNNISVISWRNRIFVFCPVERLSLIFQHFSTLFISLPKNVIYIFRKHVTILYNYRVTEIKEFQQQKTSKLKSRNKAARNIESRLRL